MLIADVFVIAGAIVMGNVLANLHSAIRGADREWQAGDFVFKRLVADTRGAA
jgi:hypothetical protein